MNTSKVVIGIAAGVAAGALAGILLAPDKGVNLRKQIAQKTKGYVDNAKGTVTDFVDGVLHAGDARNRTDNGSARDKTRTIGVSDKTSRQTI